MAKKPILRTEIEGAKETRDSLNKTAQKLMPDVFRAMRKATLFVERDAKRNSPVDTGRLRGSITSDVTISRGLFGSGVTGIVGSNVKYAPFQENGTGIFAGRSRYFPPPRALERWALRHGFASGYVVALAIFKRGGTKGKRYLAKALEKNKRRINELIGKSVATTIKRN